MKSYSAFISRVDIADTGSLDVKLGMNSLGVKVMSIQEILADSVVTLMKLVSDLGHKQLRE